MSDTISHTLCVLWWHPHLHLPSWVYIHFCISQLFYVRWKQINLNLNLSKFFHFISCDCNFHNMQVTFQSHAWAFALAVVLLQPPACFHLKRSVIMVIKTNKTSITLTTKAFYLTMKVTWSLPALMGLFRAVASLTVPGGQEFHFLNFFLKFRSILLIFPQTLLIFFLILVLRVGKSPTRKALATPLDLFVLIFEIITKCVSLL